MDVTESMRPAHEVRAHCLMLRVLRCRNGADRMRVMFSVLKDPEIAPSVDWALERGFLSYGTTNASAKTWSRWAEGSLYLTKAGKAWLRANDQGRHDFGSSRVMAEMKALLWAKVEGRVA